RAAGHVHHRRHHTCGVSVAVQVGMEVAAFGDAERAKETARSERALLVGRVAAVHGHARPRREAVALDDHLPDVGVSIPTGSTLALLEHRHDERIARNGDAWTLRMAPGPLAGTGLPYGDAQIAGGRGCGVPHVWHHVDAVGVRVEDVAALPTLGDRERDERARHRDWSFEREPGARRGRRARAIDLD